MDELIRGNLLYLQKVARPLFWDGNKNNITYSYVHNMPKKMRVLTELHIIITLKLVGKPEWSFGYEDEYEHDLSYK